MTQDKSTAGIGRWLPLRPKPFEDAAEELRFIEFYRAPGLSFLNVGVWLGIFAYLFFFILESSYPAARTSYMQQGLRVGMITILLALVFAISANRQRVLTHLAWFSGIAGAAIMAGTAGIAAGYRPSDAWGLWSLMGSVMLVSFIIYGFSRLPVWLSAAIGFGGAIALMVLTYDLLHQGSWVARMAGQLVFANLAGIALVMVMERRERSFFKAAARLDEVSAALQERARDAVEADLMKSRLLAGVSHDLRQPMTGLLAHASVLANFAGDFSSRDVRERARSMQTIIETMDTQLQKLMDISRRPSQKDANDLDRVSLSGVIEHVASIYDEAATQAGVRLITRSPWAWRDVVYSRRSDLVEVVSHLVFNAIKYTRGRRRAGVVIGVRPGLKPGTRRLVVIDNGVGIEAKHISRIFDPYFSIDTRESASYLGRGLGLAQARALVECLPGHTLAAHSRPGHGSIFEIMMPAVTEASDPVACSLDQTVAPLRGTYVLLVDDDVTVMSSMAEMIRTWGAVVDARPSFAGAVEAIEHAEREYDLLIVDYSIDNGKTGLDVWREVARSAVALPPTIIITGDPQQIQDLAVKREDIVVMSKPVRADGLAGTALALVSEYRLKREEVELD